MFKLTPCLKLIYLGYLSLFGSPTYICTKFQLNRSSSFGANCAVIDRETDRQHRPYRHRYRPLPIRYLLRNGTLKNETRAGHIATAVLPFSVGRACHPPDRYYTLKPYFQYDTRQITSFSDNRSLTSDVFNWNSSTQIEIYIISNKQKDLKRNIPFVNDSSIYLADV